MSMLTLNGQVMNVFTTPESKDVKTGEIRPAADRVQIHAENMLENGEKRFELVTLKVASGDAYRKCVGKLVRVPVGAFVSGKAIVYYALKGENPQLIPS
jgi:hypothetical protein